MKKTNDYNDRLRERLKDPREAANYLNAVLDEGDPQMFLIALRKIAEAYGGMARVAKHTRIARSNLYKMFSATGRPEFQTLHRLLVIFGSNGGDREHPKRFSMNQGRRPPIDSTKGFHRFH